MATSKDKPPGESPVGDRLWELRRIGLNLSGEKFAEKCGIKRTEVSQLEHGRNKGSTTRVQGRIARGVGVTIELFDAYLNGKLTLQELLARRVTGGDEPPLGAAIAAAEGPTPLHSDRYPTRARIVRAARVAGISETLVLALEAENHHPEDPGRKHWLKRLAELCVLDSELTTPGTDPAGSASGTHKRGRKIR